MKIIVTGSLGRIGKPLTEALVKNGHAVTVISTNPNKQKDIEAVGATAAIGDIEDIDFLTKTFTGADVVHAMIPPIHTVPDMMAQNIRLGNCLVKAIEQSGVKRVLYVSSYGAHAPEGTGLIVGHYHIEQALNKLNLEALTHLRATYIYYNLYAYVPMIKATGTISVNYGGDDKVILVSPDDIAAAAVVEIENQQPGNYVKYVASDERSCNDIAKVVGEAIGKPGLKWTRISDEQMLSNFKANGVPPIVATQLVELYGAKAILREDYDLHKPVTLGKVKLEDFVKEFATAFNQNN